MVYSTNPDFEYETEAPENIPTLPPQQQEGDQDGKRLVRGNHQQPRSDGAAQHRPQGQPQQQLADRAQVGIATIKRIEKGGGLNLDTLISLLRALNKLHHLDAILFESEVRNFNEGHEGGESVGRLQVRQQAADLNRKASAPQSEEMSYSAAIENTLYW